MRKILFLTMVVMLWSAVCFSEESFKIGVLARDGPVQALKMWQPTAEYLTKAVEGQTFELVPLDFPEVFPAVQNKTVDFFIVNSSMFMTAKVLYGAEALATMVVSRHGTPSNAFGGVVLTMAHREDINTLDDLKGKSFMAVSKTSFGGWQMAQKELQDAGIDPKRDFSRFEFGGTHHNVVYSLQAEAFDVGTVRTDTLERLAADGMIFLDDFKVINQIKHDGFPFLCSTALYPEWPMAGVQGVQQDVSQAVVTALVRLKPEDKAAKDANLVGWVPPLDYGPVEELQKMLGIGAYE